MNDNELLKGFHWGSDVFSFLKITGFRAIGSKRGSREAIGIALGDGVSTGDGAEWMLNSDSILGVESEVVTEMGWLWRERGIKDSFRILA